MKVISLNSFLPSEAIHNALRESELEGRPHLVEETSVAYEDDMPVIGSHSDISAQTHQS